MNSIKFRIFDKRLNTYNQGFGAVTMAFEIKIIDGIQIYTVVNREDPERYEIEEVIDLPDWGNDIRNRDVLSFFNYWYTKIQNSKSVAQARGEPDGQNRQ